MKASAKVLAVLHRYHPASGSFDGHGPLINNRGQTMPEESPVSIGAAVAAEYLRSLWVAEKIMEGGGRGVSLDIEDWCPTAQNRFSLPPWWHPTVDPDPPPEWRIAFHAGFAGHLAAVAAQLKGSALERPANAALDRSLAVLDQDTP